MGVRALAAAFEKATGNKVDVSFQGGAALNQKINSAPGDLASLSFDQFDDFVKGGKIVAGSVVEYGRVGNGVAVKAGAPKPDISTPEAFKAAMLNAKSIGHTAVGTGPFNTRLFMRLGIYDQIKDRIKLIQGRLVAAAVADGDVELGIQQTNVIQPYPGTDYLGPLPAELMEYGRVGVGLLTVSTHPEEAKAFIRFMTDPANAELLRMAAMEPRHLICACPLLHWDQAAEMVAPRSIAGDDLALAMDHDRARPARLTAHQNAWSPARDNGDDGGRMGARSAPRRVAEMLRQCTVLVRDEERHRQDAAPQPPFCEHIRGVRCHEQRHRKRGIAMFQNHRDGAVAFSGVAPDRSATPMNAAVGSATAMRMPRNRAAQDHALMIDLDEPRVPVGKGSAARKRTGNVSGSSRDSRPDPAGSAPPALI